MKSKTKFKKIVEVFFASVFLFSRSSFAGSRDSAKLPQTNNQETLVGVNSQEIVQNSMFAPRLGTRWSFIIGGGASFPFSRVTSEKYNPGFLFTVGLGYQFSNLFSVWGGFEADSFTSRDKNFTDDYDLSLSGIPIWAQFDFGEKDKFHTYVFAGGVLGNDSFDKSEVVNGLNENSSLSNFSVADKLGLGLVVPIETDELIFFTVSIGNDFSSEKIYNLNFTDSTIDIFSIELGLKGINLPFDKKS